jgi:hypothetical protein
MRKLLLAAALVTGSIPLMATQSEAVVCARSVYRAGCAGPNGAVGVRAPYGVPTVARPVVAPPAAGVVVGPRGGAAVYRRW